jgi:methionyl-tRNA formyltransferase
MGGLLLSCCDWERWTVRLLFCVNRDVYSCIALNTLLPALVNDTCAVVFSDGVGRRGKRRSPVLDFLKFYEQTLPNDYLFPLYESLPTSTHGELKTFRQLSDRYNVPMTGLANINAPDGLAHVRAFGPDIILSIRFGHIFKQEVLKIPTHGVINLHSGLLPAYRGILATFWSLLNQESEYGYTLHHISDASIDTGDVIASAQFPTEPSQSLFWHVVNIYPHAAVQMLQAIQGYRVGVVPVPTPQPAGTGNYYGLPETADFECFQHRGLRLLDATVYHQWLHRFCAVLPNGGDVLETMPFHALAVR